MNRPSMPTPTPFLLAAATLAATLLAPAARAATITVTTTDMAIDAGSCTDAENDITISDLSSGDGDTSLPEAICAANGTAGADVIELQARATYTITEPHNYWYGPTGLPAVSSDITIAGNGAVIERSAAEGTPKLRLFYVAGELHPVFVPGEGEEGPLDPTPGDLTLRNLTLRNGLARGGHAGYRGGGGAGLGGAIYNQGSLLLDGVTATGNVAEGGSSADSDGGFGGGGLGGDGGSGGGGFRGDSNFFPSGGDFLGDEGGGNSSSGTSAIGGDGGDAGGGGGFVADGENGIGGDGGGDGNGGSAGGAFGGGGGRGGGGVGGGGGFDLGGTSGGGGGFGGGGAFQDGAGGFGGGGGRSFGSALEDGAGGFGGGGGGSFGDGAAGGGGSFAGDGGEGNGGGGGGGLGGVVFNHFGALGLVNSTLTANTAGGGDGGEAGGGGAGLGGAVFNLNGTVTVESSTLAGNTVSGGAGGGDGQDGQGAGGAIFHHFQDAGNSGVGNSIVGTTADATTLTLEDSILADSTADPADPPDPNTFDAGNDCFVTDGTTVNLQGANLIESNATDANGCGSGALSADPQLDALADNGGPTETMAIDETNPAFDAAGACPPPATDQRGVARPQGTACDVGAFEIEETTLDRDFGDAPDPYPTLLANDGARHVLSADLFLGACADAEADGQPTAAADGDDTGDGAPEVGACSGADDEDGAVFTSDLVQGVPATLEVTASDAGRLDAWIDWNADGDWDDASEQVLTSESLSAGTSSLSVSVPAGATPGTTFVRFRLSTDGGLAPNGFAADGEVEDQPVTVLDATFRSDVVGTKEITGGDLTPGGTVVYTVVLTNLGPGLQQDNPGNEFVDVLPPELALVSASADSGTATADPGTDTVTWNGEIPAGGTVTITIEATIPEDTPLDTAIANQGTIHYDADGTADSNEATRLTDDPAEPGSEAPTVFLVGAASVLEIPTLTEWALWLLALTLAGLGMGRLRA